MDQGNLFSKLTLVKLPSWRIFPIVNACVWEIWYIPWCLALCWRSLVGDYRQSGMLVMLCPLCSWNMCALGYFHQNVPFISLFGKIMNMNLNFAWQNTTEVGSIKMFPFDSLPHGSFFFLLIALNFRVSVCNCIKNIIKHYSQLILGRCMYGIKFQITKCKCMISILRSSY